jgi:hypothetical protein
LWIVTLLVLAVLGFVGSVVSLETPDIVTLAPLSTNIIGYVRSHNSSLIPNDVWVPVTERDYRGYGVHHGSESQLVLVPAHQVEFVTVQKYQELKKHWQIANAQYDSECKKQVEAYNLAMDKYNLEMQEYKKAVAKLYEDYDRADSNNAVAYREQLAAYEAQVDALEQTKKAFETLKNDPVLLSARNDCDLAMSRLNSAREVFTDEASLYQKQLNELSSTMNSYIFTHLPAPIATFKTDAEGQCKGRVPKAGRYAVAAHFSRTVVGEKEDNYWLVWLELDSKQPKKLILSNDNQLPDKFAYDAFRMFAQLR